MSLNTRLDQSLQQIINESRNKQSTKPKAKAMRKPKAKMVVAKRVSDISSRLSAPGGANQSRRMKNTGTAVAQPAKARTGISARLGAAGSSSSKVIGKGGIAGRVGKATKADISGGRLAGLAEKKKVEQKSIAKADRRISIKGEAGPATVFISNLDTEASAEDVKTCFKQFGSIKNCTLLYDRTGKASGHAEITYAVKTSAEEAVAALNNALADGRRLRLQLIPTTQAPEPTPSRQTQGHLQAVLQQQQHQHQQQRSGHPGAHRGGGRKHRRAGGSHMDIDF